MSLQPIPESRSTRNPEASYEAEIDFYDDDKDEDINFDPAPRPVSRGRRPQTPAEPTPSPVTQRKRSVLPWDSSPVGEAPRQARGQSKSSHYMASCGGYAPSESSRNSGSDAGRSGRGGGSNTGSGAGRSSRSSRGRRGGRGRTASPEAE
jgi:hypothetical protein